MPMFRVTTLDVDLENDEYVVTLGASDQPTSVWAIGRAQALMLILAIAEAEGIDAKVAMKKPKVEPWTPWLVKSPGA